MQVIPSDDVLFCAKSFCVALEENLSRDHCFEVTSRKEQNSMTQWVEYVLRQVTSALSC